MSGDEDLSELQASFEQAVNLQSGDRAAWHELLQQKVQNPRLNLDLSQCLISAAREGNTDALMTILGLCPSLQAVDVHGKRALHYAAYVGPAQNVKSLLRAGAAVNCSQVPPRGSRDIDWTPLHLACLHCNVETAQVLIREGANVNSFRSDQKLTPIHIATKAGHVPMVKLLLDNRANPDCVAHCLEQTPLEMATKAGNMLMVSALCEGGADPNFQHLYGDQGTVLQCAVKEGEMELVQTLLVHSCKITFTDKISYDLLAHAIQNHQPEMLKMLCQARIKLDILSPTNDRLYPILLALNSKQQDMVEILLDYGANTNFLSILGKCCLHIALENMASEKKNGRPLESLFDIIHMLINQGLDVDKADANMDFPIHLAIRHDFLDVARLLCEKHPDLVHAADKKGQTPFHMACGKGDLDFVETLLGHGADIHALDQNGRTPLFNAIEQNRSDVVKQLLELGARVDLFDTILGMTPLHVAAILERVTITEMLIAQGADLEASAPNVQDTPLMMSAGCSAVATAECLLKHGANVNAFEPTHNFSVLHRAVVHYKPGEAGLRMIEVLVKGGADLTLTDDEGYTPLDRCIFTAVIRRQDRLPAIKLLVEAGARLGPQAHTQGRSSPLFWLAFSGMLREAYYLGSIGWPLQQETWITLPGKDEAQDKLHAFLMLLRAASRSLRDLTRTAIRSHLHHCTSGREILSHIEQLPLPAMMRSFMAFQDRDYADTKQYFECLLLQANIAVPDSL